jgi:hypothetical protein
MNILFFLRFSKVASMLSYFKEYYNSFYRPLSPFTLKYNGLKIIITDQDELKKLDKSWDNLDWSHIKVPVGINPITNEPYSRNDVIVIEDEHSLKKFSKKFKNVGSNESFYQNIKTQFKYERITIIVSLTLLILCILNCWLFMNSSECGFIEKMTCVSLISVILTIIGYQCQSASIYKLFPECIGYYAPSLMCYQDQKLKFLHTLLRYPNNEKDYSFNNSRYVSNYIYGVCQHKDDIDNMIKKNPENIYGLLKRLSRPDVVMNTIAIRFHHPNFIIAYLILSTIVLSGNISNIYNTLITGIFLQLYAIYIFTYFGIIGDYFINMQQWTYGKDPSSLLPISSDSTAELSLSSFLICSMHLFTMLSVGISVSSSPISPMYLLKSYHIIIDHFEHLKRINKLYQQKIEDFFRDKSFDVSEDELETSEDEQEGSDDELEGSEDELEGSDDELEGSEDEQENKPENVFSDTSDDELEELEDESEDELDKESNRKIKKWKRETEKWENIVKLINKQVETSEDKQEKWENIVKLIKLKRETSDDELEGSEDEQENKPENVFSDTSDDELEELEDESEDELDKESIKIHSELDRKIEKLDKEIEELDKTLEELDKQLETPLERTPLERTPLERTEITLDELFESIICDIKKMK